MHGRIDPIVSGFGGFRQYLPSISVVRVRRKRGQGWDLHRPSHHGTTVEALRLEVYMYLHTCLGI